MPKEKRASKAAAPPAAAAAAAGGIPPRPRLLSTYDTSAGVRGRPAGTNEAPYVLDLIAHPTSALLAASLSTGAVRVLSAGADALALKCDIAAPASGAGPVMCLRFGPPAAPNLFCCRGSVVQEWDVRTPCTPGSCRSYAAEDEGVSFNSLSVSADGNTLAAGAKEAILLWDVRTCRLRGTLTESHSDQVTVVEFHPTASEVLISASLDGLAVSYDLSATLDEDDCVQAVLNCGSSVVQVGFYGPPHDRLWCLTATEGLSLWTWAEGDELGRPHHDAREAARAAATGSALAPGLDVAYLIACAEWDGELGLLAGGNDGAAAFFPLSEGADADAAITIGAPTTLITGGHRDVCRAVRPPPAAVRGAVGWTLATCGDDGRVCLWGGRGDAAGGEGGDEEEGAAAGPVRAGGKGKKGRHTPY